MFLRNLTRNQFLRHIYPTQQALMTLHISPLIRLQCQQLTSFVIIPHSLQLLQHPLLHSSQIQM